MNDYEYISKLDSKWFVADVIPKRSGIYAIYFEINGIYKLCYIGSSSNLHQRIKSHKILKDKKDYYIKIKLVGDYWDRHNLVERFFIKRLKPILNKQFITK